MTLHYIYKITNKVNGKMYIGKTKNVISRFARHVKISETFSESDNHFQIIHKAIKKYGKENFLLETIEVCNEINVNEKEIFWISMLKTQDKNYGYNLTSGGDGAINVSEESKEKRRLKMLGRKHTDEHNKKISESHKGKIITKEVRQKISVANSGENNGRFGKTVSDETRKKMSNFQSMRLRGSLTEEHKKRNSEAAKNQDRSFRIPIEIKNEIVKLYLTGLYTKKQLAIQFNLKYNSVAKIIRIYNHQGNYEKNK